MRGMILSAHCATHEYLKEYSTEMQFTLLIAPNAVCCLQVSQSVQTRGEYGMQWMHALSTSKKHLAS